MRWFIQLWRCFFCWRVRPNAERDLSQAQAIISLSFGTGKGDAAGESNEQLAREVSRLQTRYFVPAIVQVEVSRALPRLHLAAIIREHSTPSRYIDTREVLRQAADICRERGWSEILLVCHHLHTWRAARVAKRLGLHILIPVGDRTPYDPVSEQWQTRGPWQWVARELPARLYYLLKGWL